MLLCRGGKAAARADEASREVADEEAAIVPRLGLGEASGEASLASVRIPPFIFFSFFAASRSFRLVWRGSCGPNWCDRKINNNNDKSCQEST
jgi:hypothetical protein